MATSLRLPVIVAILSVIWQQSTARDEHRSKISVECAPNKMKVSIKKDLIPDFELADLCLRETNCQLMEPSQNATHFSLSLPLTACGTSVEHTNNNIVYSNLVKDRPVGADSVIIRLQALEIPFRCIYSNKGSSSTVKMDILQPSVIELRPDDGSGQFFLKMSIFKDKDYSAAYTPEDFPIAVALRHRLFFQVSAETPDTSLSIIADTCYATPTPSSSHKSRYDIFLKGCIKDSTVQIHPHPLRTYRFSFETFQFVNGLAEPYVFVHCSVVLCNSTDPVSRCSEGNKHCDDNDDIPRRRLRRDVGETFELEQGPIVLIKERVGSSTEQNSQAQGAELGVSTWLLGVMSVICLICFATVAYTKWQLHVVRRAKTTDT